MQGTSRARARGSRDPTHAARVYSGQRSIRPLLLVCECVRLVDVLSYVPRKAFILHPDVKHGQRNMPKKKWKKETIQLVTKENRQGTEPNGELTSVECSEEDAEHCLSDKTEKTEANVSYSSTGELSSYCIVNQAELNTKDADESHLFCDGPGSRTRSKVSGSNVMAKHIPPSFLIQVPYRSYKRGANKKCLVCGKQARTPSDLQRHMRVHTGERPFPCIVCSKSFKCKRSQQTHQYLSHGIEEGLSSNRLHFLECQQMAKNCSSKTERPVVIDQDEDTEIIGGEHIEQSGAEMPVTFEGLFNSQKRDAVSNVDNPPSQNEWCESQTQDPTTNPTSENKWCVSHSEEPKSLVVDNPAINLTSEEIYVKEDVCELNSSRVTDSAAESVANITPTSLGDSFLPQQTKEFTSMSVSEHHHVEQEKMLGMNDKIHTCDHCKREFRSIYTLRYHLRSMHGEMVYLSPALESRLKKRRWTLPYSRLQKLSFSVQSCARAEEDAEQINQMDATEIKISLPTGIVKNAEAVKDDQKEEVMNITENISCKIKKEKQDTLKDEVNNNTPASLSYLMKNNSTLKEILTARNIASKQSVHNASFHADKNTSNLCTGFNMNNPTKPVITEPYVVPPQILLPSTSDAEEGLGNPISWESIRVTSENVLVTKLEAVHSTTQQKYVVYKCCLCGKAFSGLQAICAHLALHNDGNKEKGCDKCGASFKWRHELDLHLECHRATDRKFMPTTSPFLPSYYVNPFPIPVVTSGDQAVMPATGLLPYPFFPMPQQISPVMQPGFFPFFAATLQTATQLQPETEADMRKSTHSPSDTNMDDNFDDKNMAQNCSFQCKMCPKSFDRIFSLQRHERIHSGVKACFCKICGKGFSELRNLRHHIVRFHAETAQREPLPYRRRPSRMRNVSNSQRLVSFLKKTAVRILNSMEQHKLDPPASSVKIQTDDTLQNASEVDSKTPPKLSSSNNEQNLYPGEEPKESPLPSVDTEQSKNANSIAERIKQEDPIPHNCGIEIVYPTDVSEDDSRRKPSAELNIEAVTSAHINSINIQRNGFSMEVLQNPRKSLIGNRRKGRPYKLTTTSFHPLNTSVEENIPSLTQNQCEVKSEPSVFVGDATTGEQQELDNSVRNEPDFSHSFFANSSINDEPIDMRSTSSINSATQAIKSEPNQNEKSLCGHGLFPNFNSGLGVLGESQTQAMTSKVKPSSEGRCLFPCTYCYKTFCSLTDLNRHMSFHADIRPFKCPYCNYCSRTNSQLKVHTMRHEGIKHYMCHICNYNGVTQSDLNRHLKTRTHLLRSRNVCSCCGTGFHTRSLSDEHYKSCHMLEGASLTKLPSNQERRHILSDSHTKCTSSTSRHGNRVKQCSSPERERIKEEYYQKLCHLNRMGIAFNSEVQHNSSLNLAN